MADMLLVDGYNVVNAWPELAALMDNLEHARDKLVDILGGYGAYKDYKIIVVFDAHGVKGPDITLEVLPGKLQVVYTKQGETADSYIEKTAYRMVREGLDVYVVTSDWAEQLTILGVGAWRIPVRELRNEVLQMDKRIHEGYGKTSFNGRRRELEGRINQDVLKRLNEMRQGR